MIIINQTVIHKAFGCGVIAGIDGAYLSVLFKNQEKRFVFPDAFAQFLRFEDADAQAEVEEMIESLRTEHLEQSAARIDEILAVERQRQQELAAKAREEAELLSEQEDEDDGYLDEYSIIDWRALSLEPAKNLD